MWINQLHILDAVIIALMVQGAFRVIQSWIKWFTYKDPYQWIVKGPQRGREGFRDPTKQKFLRTLCKPLFGCSLCMTSVWGFTYIYLFAIASYSGGWEAVPVLLMSVAFNVFFESILNKK